MTRDNMMNPDRHVDRDALLINLSEIEFAALDMQLYLDTHPCDTEAIQIYNQLVREAKSLRDQFEKHFTPLLSYISESNDNYFSWIDEPWTWESNFISVPLDNNTIRR